MKILLVEDEVRLSEALVHTLKKNNYIVDVAFDGITGQQMAETNMYNVIILDRMLPKKDGLDVLRDLRKQGVTTPVLILTAKDSVKNRVEGLDSGADDYLTKPFSKSELLARIRALGRRQSEIFVNEEINIGNMSFNCMKGEIKVNGQTIKLTSKESQILEILIKNKNIVVSKEQLLEKVWGFQTDIELNNIEVYLSYLRKKLSKLDCGIVIETIRARGYCLKEAL
ncbi:DNA-binding response OmpR family regulator [Acetivibrio thermocellus AD2]|uniref:Stage 0 sporulation protein A homolog n=2 Tax=Acetivibrio thermocellus TaxID=1515 RepID=A3DDK5_ACET2|nr:response regulator transcription factor [Acetivibrio thermocellus]CDG35493.1 two component transcriptional regulator [Acetivibrio thermocellus BC1]ABN52034.1 two component transcriptional regulator, winged helix family [Acetivibrio thermocellus ATCC 27405]ADU74485.1 two component transcriptional regulator, winged helix family [Acetivibrio thermocellus DSM 1313]ALX08428.1 two component transcriptional regulator, winged helix family [Acetivibrio thermocellus AD2]ANV76177.1 two component trans